MRGILQRLRQKIIDRAYYLSSHAEEEMREDLLEARHKKCHPEGQGSKGMTRDPRRVRYRIEGPATDNRKIHVVNRLDKKDELRIITVYALEK